jgi:Tfp pilus assembly protein PilZ
MSLSPLPSQKYSILVEIFELIDALPEEKKIEILQRLALKNIDSLLHKLVMDLQQNDKLRLLDELNEQVLGKREHPRKSCVMSTDYVVADRAYRNFVKDISESGVYVQTIQPFELGDEVIQSFSLSDKQIPFKFTGEIVRIGKDGVGIRFKNLTQYQRDILRSILKNLA